MGSVFLAQFIAWWEQLVVMKFPSTNSGVLLNNLRKAFTHCLRFLFVTLACVTVGGVSAGRWRLGRKIGGASHLFPHNSTFLWVDLFLSKECVSEVWGLRSCSASSGCIYYHRKEDLSLLDASHSVCLGEMDDKDFSASWNVTRCVHCYEPIDVKFYSSEIKDISVLIPGTVLCRLNKDMRGGVSCRLW